MARVRLGEAGKREEASGGHVTVRARTATPAAELRNLDDAERAVFHGVADSPCDDVTASAVAALTGRRSGDHLLRRLVASHWLREDDAGRYSVPAHLQTVAGAGSNDQERAAAARRLVAFYATHTAAAAAAIYPELPLLVDTPTDRMIWVVTASRAMTAPDSGSVP